MMNRLQKMLSIYIKWLSSAIIISYFLIFYFWYSVENIKKCRENGGNNNFNELNLNIS